jgi:type IV pilus assembly protein PilB
MDNAHESGSFTCSYSHCRKQVSGFQARFLKGLKYRLNGSRLCSEACFRSQCLLLAEYWLREEFNAVPTERRQKLGLMLFEARIITADQLETVLESQKADQRRRVGDVVQELGYATEKQITYLLSRQEGLPWLDVESDQIATDVLERVPPEVAVMSLIAPLEYNGILNELSVISACPVDRLAVDALEKMSQCHVNVFISPESKVRRLIARYYTIPLESRDARSTIRRETEALEPLVEAVSIFYRRASAGNLDVARCRELLWLRATNPTAKHDWFVLLEPFTNETLVRWRRETNTIEAATR